MQTSLTNTAAHDNSRFFSLIRHPVKFRLYLLKNLPAAWASGLKIIDADAGHCRVMVPFRWFTKNPFGSTYFACLSMAAELSTGVLAMAQVYRRQPKVSMLVVSMKARFYKKTTGKTIFFCADGEAIAAAVQQAIDSDTAQEIEVYSAGRNESGEPVAEFWIKWSFKAK